MTNLGVYIYELLQTHDCVIVPDLGGFITRKEDATIHSVQNLFTPLSRTVFFNDQLVHNDGLLTSFIASKESVDYEVALKNLKYEINEIFFSLYKGESVEFTQIGTLSINNERIDFKSNTGQLIQEDTYGLKSFILPLIQRERPFQPKPIEPSFSDESKQNRHIGRYVSVAASIVILLGCFSYLILFQKPSDFNLSNLCPEFQSWFDTEKSAQTTVTTSEHKTTTPFVKPSVFKDVVFENDSPVKDQPIDSVVVADEISNNIETNSPSTEIVKNEIEQQQVPKIYYVIGASYELRKNAEIKCDEIKALGYDATVLDAPSVGRFRVSYGNFATEEEANTLLEEVRESYRRDAWLLKSK